MQYRVLIVDDSKLARMVMASAFRRIRADWELIEATNATDALEAISTQAVDITLVDFNMPGTDGLELVGTHSQDPSQDARGSGLGQCSDRDYFPSPGT